MVEIRSQRLSGGGGARRRRMFTPGELEVLILHLMRDGPRHGYDLAAEIEDRSGSGYAPSPGTLYPALHKLEKEDAIVALDTGPSRRRTYVMTSQGAARLTAHEQTVDRVLERLERLRPPSPLAQGELTRTALKRLDETVNALRGSIPETLDAQVAARLDDLALLMRRERTPLQTTKEG